MARSSCLSAGLLRNHGARSLGRRRRDETTSAGGVPGIWVRRAEGPEEVRSSNCTAAPVSWDPPKAYVNLVGQLVARTGIPAFVANYALAPEHPFPGAIEDASRTFTGLVDQGFERIALIGDSARGGLALAFGSQFRAHKAAPRAIVGISPWTDLTLASPSMETRGATDPIWSATALAEVARLYLGD